MPSFPLSDAFYFQVFDVRPGKTEKQKLRIIEATIESIAKVGFDRTTFDLVGKRVGMQRAHVNYYFSSREELMKTSVRYAVALGQQITIGLVQDATGWKERLKAVIEGPFEWLARYPQHASVMTIFYHHCTFDPEYKKLQGTIRAGGEARIEACFRELVEKKMLSRKRSLELARAIQAIMTGNLIYAITCEFPLSREAAKKWTVKLAFEIAGIKSLS